MHKLKLICAAALASALTLIVAPATQAATTCTVPGDHSTIQSAVDDPTCDTVKVAPGTYPENVLVQRTVTIQGAQAGNRFDARSGVGESIVTGLHPNTGNSATFTIKAPTVEIDGFTIKNANTSSAASGIDVKTEGNDAVISNNIIDGVTTPDLGGNGTAQGIYLERGPDNVNISNNEIKNVHSNRSAKGVLIGDNHLTDPSQDAFVKANSIHDITSDTSGAYGISVANVTPGTSGLQVLKNSFSNLTGGGWVHAIGLEGDTPNVSVQENDISGLTSPSADKIAVFFESENVSFASAHVNFNNFNVAAPTAGIVVQQPPMATGAVDGMCNWWGSADGPGPVGPGTGALVSAKVNYAPWLIAPAPGGSCFGGNVPTTTAQCKNGGWTSSVRADGSTFKNQGDCMQYVNTGK